MTCFMNKPNDNFQLLYLPFVLKDMESYSAIIVTRLNTRQIYFSINFAAFDNL